MASGTRLGQYEILAALGAGGMGEVYRAHDTKLKRDVALKVLPETFANDPERMARFDREAEVLASLNHPNIAHIYGVEDRALVMELVEGESPKGPLPFEEAWKIVTQIADALEYAHERGVVHRDLKPANVKVTPEGVVKLLDFGLAKAFSPDAGEPHAEARPTDSPTLTLGATVAGVIVGTAAYMAPEQAKGKRVDKRADIWSWGVMLYELLTGERLFKGEDTADTLAQVLTKEPDLERVPAHLRRLLRRCLEKDPKKRLRDIGEAQYLLEEWQQGKTRASKLLWVVVAAVFAAFATILSFLYFHQIPSAKTVQRYRIELPENTTNLSSLAISPDGRSVAISAIVKGKLQLWLRALDGIQAQPLPGTQNGNFPFWSPDSRYIGFFAEGKLKKITATGGPAQSLCDVTFGRGGSWSRDDVIIFATPGGIRRVSAAGGVPEDVMKLRSAFPVFLPDGKHFLYLIFGEPVEQSGIYLSSLEGKENRRVLTDVSSVILAAHTLLFVRENTLMAQPFDSARGRPSGEVMALAEDVFANSLTFYAPLTASETGLLLYEGREGAAAGNFQLAWHDRRGRLLGLVGAPGIVTAPAISPDEKSVAFRRTSGSQTALWIRDLTRGVEQRFTTVKFSDLPIWSPKGDRIAFSAYSDSNFFNLYQRTVGGTGEDELLLATGAAEYMSQWSRDGRFIVYRENSPKTKWDVWVLPIEGGVKGKPIAFLHSQFNEVHPQLSPDSRWMAYTSDASGRREVYVRPFPGGELQRQISITGGEQPRWRGDGRELFFVSGDGKMMAVAVKTIADTKTIEVGAPQPLFDAQLAPGPINVQFEYDVTSDGKRFLLVTNAALPASEPQLKVIANWDAGLKK